MRLRDLKDKKVLILGFGREGQAMYRALRKRFPKKELGVADDFRYVSKTDAHTTRYLGGSYRQKFNQYDVIVKSPGVMASRRIPKDYRDRITSATQIFFDTIDPSNTVIGITGSKGKSTVAMLIYKILKDAKKNVLLVGNVGNPAVSFLDLKNTIFVYELSSYQLEDLTSMPHIAVITSFFSEHLDYHGGVVPYFKAKTNITRYQTEKDFLVIHKKYRRLTKLRTEAKKIICGEDNSYTYDERYFWARGKKVIERSKIQLMGTHNMENILLALAVGDLLHIPVSTLAKTLVRFRSLPHRLELVGKYRGILFYDDAISTTPESTLAAIEIFKEKIGAILLGGEDRGYHFQKLAAALRKYRIKNIVLFPQSGRTIKKLLRGYHANFYQTKSMRDAVRFVYRTTLPGNVCLLSTASPSYSVFKNFEEKGDLFQKYVRRLCT